MWKVILPRPSWLLALVISLLLFGVLMGVGLMHGSEEGAGLGPLSGNSLLFQSAGHHSATSYVERMAGNGRVTLKRGLTLVGLTKGASPERLAHVDTCQPNAPVRDEIPTTERFQTVIEATGKAFGAYAILADDSIHCGQDADLEKLFEGLGLKAWREVNFREPYVAVMPRKGEAQEYRGGEGEVLALMGDLEVAPTSPVTQRQRDALPRVAHAGGGFEERTYTNTIAALDHNHDDYELFEIDFSWTSDDELVCLHDWDHHFESTFGQATEGAVSLTSFERLAREDAHHPPCILASLAEWLEAHPGKRIVTDVKERNVEALALIAKRYPDLQSRFVPQVYQLAEYFSAKAQGYEDIIWTLYRYPGNAEDVLALLPILDLYGLTMPEQLAQEGLAEQARRHRGVLSWVHTINEADQFEAFRELGVSNIYTDWLPE